MAQKTESLTFKIFSSTFLAGALVYFACAFLFLASIYGYFEKQIFRELENESFLIDNFASSRQFTLLSGLKTSNRITVIASDGQVIFDNTVSPSSLENHSKRQEFIEAVEKGSVTISRYSSTMTEKTLYYARLLASGDVLRISCNQHSVATLVFGMSQFLLIMLILAIIISGITAGFLSKKIVNPLNKIDLENPENSCVYEELKPFTKRIAEENFEKAQREELRQQFSANVSHELKTPLTSISGFAEILMHGGTDEKTTKDFSKTIYSESQRMISLVNDIIKLSKLDEKSISLEKEDLSLREIARDAVNVLKIQAEQKNISLSITGDKGCIKGVRPVIYEMIYNLIDNGIKYNREKGSVNVDIKSSLESKRVFLYVRDTGIGIPENEKERIFERFYRVDKSRSKESGGTGLGLSIVKHGAKYHNASVMVQSEEGKGSCFTVIFNTEENSN